MGEAKWAFLPLDLALTGPWGKGQYSGSWNPVKQGRVTGDAPDVSAQAAALSTWLHLLLPT